MPLTQKGEEVMQNMQEQYGSKKGESVFYASKNAGKLTGVDQYPVTPFRQCDPWKASEQQGE